MAQQAVDGSREILDRPAERVALGPGEAADPTDPAPVDTTTPSS